MKTKLFFFLTAYFWIGEEKNGRNEDNRKDSTLIPMHSSMVMGGEDHRIVSSYHPT